MDLSITLAGHSVWLPAVAALGVSVGLVAGMFGVGGGFLLVPLLTVALDVPVEYAVGAALCQTIATGLAAFLRHRRYGQAETRFDVMLLGGSLLGVDAGARLLAVLSDSAPIVVAGRSFPAARLVITCAYVGLFVVIAALLWWKPSPQHDDPQPGPLARIALPPLTVLPVAGLPAVSGAVVGGIGFANGLLAGLIGIGGGICLIPIMLYGYGFPIRKAAGTGIVVVLAVALLGTVQHARIGNVHLGLAATIMIGSALSAQVGAGLTRTLPADKLRRGLAILLVISIVGLVFKLIR